MTSITNGNNSEYIRNQLQSSGFNNISKDQSNFLTEKIFKGNSVCLVKIFQMKSDGLFSRALLNSIWKCDNPALIICETKSNNLFGLYYFAPWERFNQENLIFNLDSLTIHPRITNQFHKGTQFIILV